MDNKDKKLAGIIRRCLSLRYILRRRNRQLFSNILNYRTALNEFFYKAGAQLLVNEALGIAYLEPLHEFDDEIEYRLGRSVTLQPFETLLLIFLRQKRMEYFSGDIDSETPWVKREEMREFLLEFNQEKEERKFQLAFDRVLKQLQSNQILLSSEDDALYEISPVCDVVLPADEIHQMQQRAQAYFINKTASPLEEQVD